MMKFVESIINYLLKRKGTIFISALFSIAFCLSFHFTQGRISSSTEEILIPFRLIDGLLFLIIWFSFILLFEICVLRGKSFRGYKVGTDRLLGWLFIPFFIIFVYYIFYSFSFYPGTVLPDTIGSIAQILNGPETILSNHHPIIFTSWLNFWIRLAGLFTSNVNHGVYLAVVAQQFLIALGFSTSIYWCKIHGVSNWMLITMTLLYAFFPHFPMFSMALWKDPLFSLGILMITLIFATICVDEAVVENGIWCLLVATSSFLVMGFRNNGVYVIVVALIALLIFKRKHYGLTKIVLVSTISLYVLISGPIYTSLNIEKPAVEALGIPLQQTAYNLKYNIDAYSDDELDILDDILPIEAWQKSYLPRVVDEIKWNSQWNETVFQVNIGVFLKMWFHHLSDSFSNYVVSYLMATQGFWDPVKQLNHEYYAEMVVDNDFGIYRTTLADRIGVDIVPLTSLVQPLVGAGTCAWIIVFFLVISIKRNGINLVLPYVPSVALWLTLLMATPLAFGMRYALPLVFTLPLLVVLPYISSASRCNKEFKETTRPYVIKNLLLSMLGPLCFIVLIFLLFVSRDKFQLVSYSDQQQLLVLNQDTYLEQSLSFDQDFVLNRISLWTQTDPSFAQNEYSIYLALLDESGNIVWQQDVSSRRLSDDPLNPWTLFYCGDIKIRSGYYTLQIHGNSMDESSGLVVGPNYQMDKVVEPLIINGEPSNLYLNIKVIG